MKFIFVYNAESGILAALADSVRKAVSPESYPCNLCRITFGPLAVKSEWRDFVASLPHPSEFLHRDEFEARYSTNMKGTPLPAIFTEDESGLRIVVAAAEINGVHDLAGLEEIVRSALPSKQSGGARYRCPECGLQYRDKETAARCEAWCREHKSCNLDIIKDAVSENRP